jgi:hypothetical protein
MQSYAPWRIGSLPEEPQLVADLKPLAQLYAEIDSDTLEPTFECLVEVPLNRLPTWRRSKYTISSRYNSKRLVLRGVPPIKGAATRCA